MKISKMIMMITMKMNNVKYLVKQQNKFEDITDKNISELNKTARELNKQLIFSSTVFIALFGVLVNSKLALGTTTKVLLISILIGVVVSIIFGIIQYFIDYYSFNDWVEINRKIVVGIKSLGPNSEKDLDNLIKIIRDGKKEKTSILFTKLQAIFFVLSFILLIVLFVRYL